MKKDVNEDFLARYPDIEKVVERYIHFVEAVEDRISHPWFQGGAEEFASWKEAEKRSIDERIRIEIPILIKDLGDAIVSSIAKDFIRDLVEKALNTETFATGGIVGGRPLLFSHDKDEARIPIPGFDGVPLRKKDVPTAPFPYVDRPCGFEGPENCEGLEETVLDKGGPTAEDCERRGDPEISESARSARAYNSLLVRYSALEGEKDAAERKVRLLEAKLAAAEGPIVSIDGELTRLAPKKAVCEKCGGIVYGTELFHKHHAYECTGEGPS